MPDDVPLYLQELAADVDQRLASTPALPRFRRHVEDRFAVFGPDQAPAWVGYANAGGVVTHSVADADFVYADRVVTEGAAGGGGIGAQQSDRLTFVAPIDFSGRTFVVPMKFDLPAKMHSVHIRVTHNNFASYIDIPNYPAFGPTPNVPWAMSFNPADGAQVGAPATDLSAVNEIILDAYDDNTGTPVTILYGGVRSRLSQPGVFDLGVISLCFDDSGASQIANALPHMRRHGWAGQLFPIVDAIGTGGSYTQAQLDELVFGEHWGCGFHASDGDFHTLGIVDATEAQLVAELELGRAWLAARGYRSDVYACPRGVYDEASLAIVQKYFALNRINDAGNGAQLQLPPDPYRLSSANYDGLTLVQLQALVTAAATHRGWLSITIHDVVDMVKFVGLVDAIRTSGLPVRTLDEVLRANS